MGTYRLEIWFDYNQQTIDWGVAQAPAQPPNPGNPPFSNGGTALPKTADGTVQITGAGNSSTFDVYVFDVTPGNAARVLQTIEIDYEVGRNPVPGQGRDPFSDASGLRSGLTGAAFAGNANGYTTGIGQENTVFCAPGKTAQRRWSLAAGFEGLSRGHYSFDGTLTVAPQGATQGETLSFDPEMDIDP